MKSKKHFFVILLLSQFFSTVDAASTKVQTAPGGLRTSSWGLQSLLIESLVTAEETDYLGETIERVVMRSSGVGIYGFYNQFISERWVFNSGFGYEPLNAAGLSTIMGCDRQSTNQCTVNIDYLVGEVALRYIFPQPDLDLWLDFGVSIKQPFRVSSTALVSSRVSTTNNLNFGTGIDYNFDKNKFIPLSLQYSLFPKVSGVTASSLLIKFGYGWRL